MTAKQPADRGEKQDDQSGIDLRRLRRRFNQSTENWLDEVIRGAEERGMFKDLRGMGKPLPAANPQETLNEWWLANHMLKQAGFVPVWIELRKEIADERVALDAALEAYHEAAERIPPEDPTRAAQLARLEERYRTLAQALNAKIEEHNLLRPQQVGELITVREDPALQPRRR